ncbi:unnamed protein product [Adineta steineri]|nr:unnamed protein product [Adineta steineri]
MDSVEKIQQKAKECREIITESLQTCINDTEKKFNDLTEQIKHLQEENDFNEINLNYLTNQLMKIRQELNTLLNISLEHDSQAFINEISIISSTKRKFNKWKQDAITIAGGNEQGQQLNQLHGPHGIFIDRKKNIFIADFNNHRIIEWKNNAKEGKIIAGGNGQGDQLSQLNFPAYIFVDEDQSVYVSDKDNHRVMKWRKDAKEGIVVAGGNGQGENLNQVSEPQGVIVDHLGRIYVADSGNDRIMRWCEGKEEGEIVVGGNGDGNQSNQLNFLGGLAFDDEGNLYVVDWGNDRIQKFEIIL